MKATQVKFYLHATRVFEEKNMPADYMTKWFATICLEMAGVINGELTDGHIKLIEKMELFFASVNLFKEADILKRMKDEASKVIETKKLFNKFLNAGRNDSKTN